MIGHVDRPVIYQVLPLAPDAPYLHVDQMILVYEKGQSVDVGQLCYSDVEKGVRMRAKGARVDINSFKPNRLPAVRKLVEFLSKRFQSREYRPLTAKTHARRAVEFVGWCYENNFDEILSSREMAERALIDYTEHLRQRVRVGSLNPNTAGPMQSDARNFFAEYFRDVDFARGMRRFERGNQFATPTELPDEDAVSRALALSFTFFSELSNLVLNNLPLPYCLKMPPYLGMPNHQLWYFSGRKPFMTSYDRAQREQGEPINKWRPLDFENGVIARLEDIVQHYPPIVRYVGRRKREYPNYSDARKSIAAASKKLALANASSVHPDRIEAAMKAHNAFIVLFAADTGMNEAGIRDCPWNDDFIVAESRPNFRFIKFRAAKEVSFEVSTRFLPYFKRFIALRAFALNGHKCHTLFFTLGPPTQKQRGVPSRMSFNPLSRAYDLLLRIDPTLERVLTRQWRINSIDFYIRNADVRTAALIVQNNEEAVKRHYAAGSETTASIELSNFFSSVKAQVTAQRASNSDGNMNGKLLGCIAPGEPNAIDINSHVKPSCREIGGCLFCDKFSVHGDEKDARKLLSCKLVINRGMHLSANEEHFARVFGDIIKRIDLIIDEIGRTSSEAREMTRRVAFEVEEDGLLDPHFQAKLDQMADLNILF